MTRNLPEAKWSGLIQRSEFNEYSKKCKDFFIMKRENGIIELRMHTNGGPYCHSWAGHNAINQVWVDVGNDPENEVMILTATGDRWFTSDPKVWDTPYAQWTSDAIYQLYFDMTKLVENMIQSIEIPTIAAINGPGVHTEIALLCDITLCTDDVNLFDPHFLVGSPPGDGLSMIFQELMGPKNAAYYLYEAKNIDARTALQLGLVNEILPREALLKRAWEIAEKIMQKPRIARRLTHSIIVRPYRQRIVNDLNFHVANQCFTMLGLKPEEEKERSEVLMQEASKRKGW